VAVDPVGVGEPAGGEAGWDATGSFDPTTSQISPTGDRILALRRAEQGYELVLLSVGDGSSTTIEWCRGTFAVSWEPDGGRLACVAQGGAALAVGDLRPDSEPVVVPLPGRVEGSPAWSPDGAQVAFALEGDGERVYVLGRDGRGTPQPVQGLRGEGTRLRWVPQP